MRRKCTLYFTNLYKQATFQSEIVSQMLRNETFLVLEQLENWSKVQLDFDAYQGYIPNNMLGDAFEGIPEKFFSADSQHLLCLSDPEKKQLQSFALSLLGTPYFWGGRSPFGLDCSGFVQLCCKQIGYQIPRDAAQQAMMGKEVKEDFLPLDLLFFRAAYENKSKITHVGFCWEDGKVLHASGRVKLDKLAGGKIFDGEKVTHTMLSAKRLFKI